jgi:sulfate adenylyltransferase large subunit
MQTSEPTLELEPAVFSLSSFLAAEESRDLLRFSTAGSVDDGKSTLIGRLLYDTQSVYEDQVRSIEGKGTTGVGVLDLALLTDGLRAEREQGITIDVAYRYFSTRKRKFIIADTPGHEQYTRNMATGASTASLAIVLVDARKGVLIQSRRHACITALLGVRHIVVAVNKMDLVNYDEQVFDSIRSDFTAFFEHLGDLQPPHLYFIPVSALEGDNVVRRASAMPWYDGPSLLELLESVEPGESSEFSPFRFAVQRVIRPNQNFRGFAGQIAAGTIRPGDTVMALPSRRTSQIRRVVTFDGDLQKAMVPQSVTITLTDELDVSRGDLIVTPGSPAITTARFTASMIWMDEEPLDLARRYLLKHTSRTVPAQISAVIHHLDVATLERNSATSLRLNEIGLVEIATLQPLAVDTYLANRSTGSFILINPITNATVAAGMIRSATEETATGWTEPISAAERIARWHHSGAVIHIEGPKSFADGVERVLFSRGAFVVRLASQSLDTLAALVAAGVLVMTYSQSDVQTVKLDGLDAIVARNVDELLHILEDHGILQGEPKR